jgi:hypothetical protein
MKHSMLRGKFSLPVFVPFGAFLGIFYLLINLPRYESPSRLQTAGEMSGHDENPHARAQWELERLRDPKTGFIPTDIRRKELAFASRLDRQNSAFKNNAQSSQSLSWNERGPGNIGGRTRALAFDISNDNIIMAASVAGGLWRSEDQGVTWRKISTPNQLQNVTTIVQDPRPGHTNIWYYGTGEHDGSSFNGEAYTGDGIYKSTDGGVTWLQLRKSMIRCSIMCLGLLSIAPIKIRISSTLQRQRAFCDQATAVQHGKLCLAHSISSLRRNLRMLL